MSLKDRLKSTANNQNVIAQEIKQQQPKYYESNEAANKIGSLGAIDTLFIDDELNSIYISGAKNVYVERKGKSYKSTTNYRDNVQLENLIKKYAQNIGKEINENTPHIKFNHAQGINVSATLPPLSNVPTMFIKCYKDKHATMQILQEEQSISKELALVLEILSAIKCNIIIAGEKNTLKTTLLSAMAKKVPTNNRGIVVDSYSEFDIQNSNFTNFNFEILENKETKIDILNTIINSNPDKLFVNDLDENILSFLAKKCSNNFKGLAVTIEACNPLNAIEKITQSVLSENPYINYEIAKEMTYRAFELIIFTTRDELGKRKITSISELNIDKDGNCVLNDIFNLNHFGEYQATGFTPKFFEIAKLNSMPISSNVFETDYRHTFHQSYKNDALSQFTKRPSNIDILKKFKKDLPTQNSQEEKQIENEIAQNIEEKEANLEAKQDEIMQKAQEKFEELCLNSESISQAIEIAQQAPIEENNENLQ